MNNQENKCRKVVLTIEMYVDYPYDLSDNEVLENVQKHTCNQTMDNPSIQISYDSESIEFED